MKKIVRFVETDGYVAVQVVTGTRRASRVTRPMAGHYKKAGVEAGRGAWEFRVDSIEEFELGSEIKVDLFEQARWRSLKSPVKLLIGPSHQ